MKKTYIIRGLLAFLGICLITAGIWIGVYLHRHPGLLAKPDQIRDRVNTMLGYVSAGDYRSAGAMLHNGPNFGSVRPPEDEIGQLMWNAYQSSITYEIVGNCRPEGSGVVQMIRFTCLDMDVLTERFSEQACMGLEQRIADAELVSEIYDSNKEYRKELIDEILLEAAETVVREDGLLKTTELTLRLVRADKQWMILPEAQLLATISGGGWKSGDGTASEMDLMQRCDLVRERVMQTEKVFWLRDEDPISPEPDQACYGTSTDPESLGWLLDSASKLLDGQETLFSTDVEILPGSEVMYYLDDTIFCVTWQQVIDGGVFTISEVKIAHASQFRRYLVGDAYGTRDEYYGTNIAAEVNAVTASNGDYYRYRGTGIVVYKGEVCRVNNRLDICCIDDEGEMILVRNGELNDWESAERFVEDNNIRFSLAFGPILVENGQNTAPRRYSVGEIAGQYPRTGLGSLGKLHYVLVAAGTTRGYGQRFTIWQFADHMAALGCDKAYALDGGQTSIIVTNDMLRSFINYGRQRTVSDIVYFATAIPDGT